MPPHPTPAGPHHIEQPPETTPAARPATNRARSAGSEINEPTAIKHINGNERPNQLQDQEESTDDILNYQNHITTMTVYHSNGVAICDGTYGGAAHATPPRFRPLRSQAAHP